MNRPGFRRLPVGYGGSSSSSSRNDDYQEDYINDKSEEIEEKSRKYTMNLAYNFSSFTGFKATDLQISRDIVEEFEYQSIKPRTVAIKCAATWLLADDVGRAAIYVCCLAGNKHSKILRKGRIAGARYLDTIFVDSNGPKDLTLGRFLVTMACIFAQNSLVPYHTQNCGHAAYDAQGFTDHQVYFLHQQLRWWKTYNPGEIPDEEVINKTARIMCLQRASCVVNLITAVGAGIPAFTAADFQTEYGMLPPTCAISAPAFTVRELTASVQALTLKTIAESKRRAGVPVEARNYKELLATRA